MNLNNNNLFNKGFFQQTPQKDNTWQSSNTNSNLYGSQQNQSTPFSGLPAFPPKNTFDTSAQSSLFSMSQQPHSFGISNNSTIPNQPSSFSFNDISARSNVPLSGHSNTTSNMNQSSRFASSSFGTSSPFGNSNNTAFGASNPTPFINSNTNSFGSTNTKPSTFSQPNTTSTNSIWGTTTGFNNISTSNKGSKITPYMVTRFKDDSGIYSEILNICAMSAYSNSHTDEIRNEDYELSRKPTYTNNQTTQSSFAMPFSSRNPLQSQNSSQLQNPLQSQNSSQLQNPLQSQNSFQSQNPSQLQNSFQIQNPLQPQNSFQSQNSSQLQNPLQPQNPSQPQVSNFNTTSLFGNTSVQKPQSLFSTPQASGFPVTNSLFSNNNSTLLNNTSQIPFNSIPASNNLSSSSFPSNSLSFNSNSSPVYSSLNNNLSLPTNSLNNFKPTVQSPVNSASSFFPQINIPQSTQFSSPFNSFQPKLELQNTNPQFVQPNSIQIPVEYSDPYLIKNIKFEQFQPQKPSLRQLEYKLIFNTKKEYSDDLFHIRLPTKHFNSNIYTIPEITEENVKIKNLVVVFNGIGKIEYLESVTIINRQEIENKIKFKNETVEIADEPGLGLNKRARVFIENLYPYSRASNSYLKGKCEKWPEKGVQERFIYQLKNNQYKKFIDYDCDSGLYVYEVNHF